MSTMFGDLKQLMRNEAQSCLLIGDCLQKLSELPADSVHMVFTSPPYWGLIDYQCEGQLGQEAEPYCVASLMPERMRESLGIELCGECYNCHMIKVCRKIFRVLRPDGTLWLNLGYSYTTGGRVGHGKVGPKQKSRRGMDGTNDPARAPQPEHLKEKDLILVPQLLAHALQLDGWYLRSYLPWVRRNPMPESAEDRPGQKAVEAIFQLTKSTDYYFDMEAVRREAVSKADSPERYEERAGRTRDNGWHGERAGETAHTGAVRPDGTRNFRSSDLWYDSVDPAHGLTWAGDEMVGIDTRTETTGAAEHFAVFPTWLVSPFVEMSSSEKGVCPECGAPWRRVTKDVRKPTRPGTDTKIEGKDSTVTGNRDARRHIRQTNTLGWAPTCGCYGSPLMLDGCTEKAQRGMLEDFFTKTTRVPAIVLDPFAGTCTTLLQASRMGRRSIGIELNPAFAAEGKLRVEMRGKLMPAKKRKNAPSAGFGFSP